MNKCLTFSEMCKILSIFPALSKVHVVQEVKIPDSLKGFPIRTKLYPMVRPLFWISGKWGVINLKISIYIYILCQSNIRESLNKFPDFFRMGAFIDSTHIKL